MYCMISVLPNGTEGASQRIHFFLILQKSTLINSANPRCKYNRQTFPHLVVKIYPVLSMLHWVYLAKCLYKETITATVPVLHWAKQDGAVMMR